MLDNALSCVKGGFIQGVNRAGVEARSFASSFQTKNTQTLITLIGSLRVLPDISRTYRGIASCYTSVERAINYEKFYI